jgi:hypothetical protein
MAREIFYINNFKAIKCYIFPTCSMFEVGLWRVAGATFHTGNYCYSSGPEYATRRQRIRLEIQELENRHADAQATLKTNKLHYFQLSANVQKLKSEEYTLKQELQENLRKIGMLISMCMHF